MVGGAEGEGLGVAAAAVMAGKSRDFGGARCSANFGGGGGNLSVQY